MVIKKMARRSILDELAALEHEQWVAWSQKVAVAETISGDQLERWMRLWIPYEELSERWKEEDLKWARKALKIIENKLGALQ